MSIIHHKLSTLLLCGIGNPHRQPFDGLIHHFTHSGSLAQHAAHHGLLMRTKAMTAAAATSAAAAGSAAVSAAAAGTVAFTAAMQQGRVWGMKAVWAAFVMVTTGWVGIVAASWDHTTLFCMSLPRTLRTARWAVRAGLGYKKFAAAHADEDPESDAYQDAIGEVHTHWATELLAVCRANGGVYIKAGQFASAFGAVPREYRLTLAGLEDRAAPRPFEAIEAVLRQELGPHAMQLFSEFEPNATAAASLAQVHRARLLSGEEVAVKVQYPGLASSVAADLAVLRLVNVLAALLFPSYRLAWLVEELDKKLALEMDFRTELLNVRRVGSLLVSSKAATVPHMHEQLCTPRLLVMEWIDGVKVNDKPAIQAQGISPQEVGRRLVKLFGELTLVQGFMHGDPHAGNLMVRRKGRRSIWSWLFGGSRQPFELVLLDHGTYLDLTHPLRQQMCQLWCSFMLGDSALQSDLCTAAAGERGPTVLPVLLTQSARSRSEERAVRKAAGISGVGDMAALLQAAPREVVEVLRINTVIRSISHQLGVDPAERKRILARSARKGLPSSGDHSWHVHPRFRQLVLRAKLALMLGMWQCGASVKGVLVRGWSMVLGLWQDVLLE